MKAADVASTPPPAETSTFRLYLMRALYPLNAVALGAEVWAPSGGAVRDPEGAGRVSR